eukprot:GILI01018118.1.p1 GENE.GILI01018118.1~~GILI01018118.1.p1  ORF type:complete len:514 (-),score=142.70 GILI01018118.1:141-1682(-)
MSHQPTQFVDVETNLTAFFKALDPTTTLLDVAAIEHAEELKDGMGQHGGMSGAMIKISVTYNSTTPTGDKHRPATLICKTTRPTEQSRASSKAMLLPREALFLKHIKDLQVEIATGEHRGGEDSLVALLHRHAPTLVQGLPTIYYSEGDLEAGTKLIFCQDLSFGEAKGVQSGWFLGPHSILNRGIEDLNGQIAKKGWVVVPEGPTPDATAADGATPIQVTELVTKSFLGAAELHGSFWDKGLQLIAGDGASYLRGAQWYAAALAPTGKAADSGSNYAQGKKQYDDSMSSAHAGWLTLKKNVAAAIDDKGPSAFTMPQTVATLMETCCPAPTHEGGVSAHPAYELYLERLAARPHTLVHGDFHPGNMVVYLPKEQAPYRVALVDWEVVGIGSGPQDIGQYMTSHFTQEQFSTIATKAVTAYADALIAVIAPKSEAETATLRKSIFKEVCLGGLGRWAWLNGLMGGMEAIPLGAMQYFVDQVDLFMKWCMSEASILGVPDNSAELAALVGTCRP